MTADILHKDIEFYGAPSAQRIRVKVTQEFTVIIHDAPAGFAWGTTNDRSLKITESGDFVTAKAEATGSSEIQIQVDHGIPFYLTVEVFDPAEAAHATLEESPAEPK